MLRTLMTIWFYGCDVDIVMNLICLYTPLQQDILNWDFLDKNECITPSV